MFAPEALPASVPDHQGVKVVLVRGAQAGAGTIQVNDVTRIDPQMALLIKSPDGQRQEIYNVAALFSDTDANVKLTAPLQSSFPTNSAVTQQPGGSSSTGMAFNRPTVVAAVIGVAVSVAAGVIVAKLRETPMPSPVSGVPCLSYDANGVCTQLSQ